MSSRKLILYAMGGLGMNLLNLIVSSYICSALLTGGFSEAALPFQTYAQRDLVDIRLWGSVILLAKVIDGIIDIPIGALIDKLKAKNISVKFMLGISIISVIISFSALLIIPSSIITLNTLYYGVVLCLFYISYTATMECYYSTFTDVTQSTIQIQKLSNFKSIFDIIYYIIGFVIIGALLTTFNIRVVALLALSLSATGIIPIILYKKNNQIKLDSKTTNELPFFASLKYVLTDKTFIYWLFTFMFINFGLQLFMGGINEYFSSTGMNMMIIMASVFLPLPASFWLSSKHYQKKGFLSALTYSLIYVILGLFMLFIASLSSECSTYIGIGAGVMMSFGIGTLFSISYSIPAKLAVKTNNRYKCDTTASYFAIQGLFGAISAGLGSGLVLVMLKKYDIIFIIPLLAIISIAVALIMLTVGKTLKSCNYLGGIND